MTARPPSRGRTAPAGEVADVIPGARLESLRGERASHLLMLERPDEFNSLVSEFLLESDRAQ